MKKVFTLFAAVMLSVSAAFAQFEIGGIVGGMNGLSTKYWLNSSMAIQADLSVGLTAAYAGMYYQGNKFGEGELDHFDFMLNPNFLYHFDVASGLKVYTGGGCGIGMMGSLVTYYGQRGGVLGKFGLNAVVGLAYEVPSVPLVLAFDFRPGYGLGFATADDAHYSMFDWHMGFAVRYKL